MINRIYSDLATFKELTFKEGLNILFSDVTPNSTSKQTRNRAGKSSLIEIIHFLHGAKCDPSSLFRSPELVEYTFGLDFQLNGRRTIVERCGSNPSIIRVLDAKDDEWHHKPTFNKKLGVKTLSNEKWKEVLANEMFKLADSADGDESSFSPSFRSLFSYFVRRESSSGFSGVFYHSKEQQLWDSQVGITTLIGLDWTIPQQWQQVRTKERSIKELSKAIDDGIATNIVGDSASLRTKLVVKEERVKRLRLAISSYHILSEYKDLEYEANILTEEINQLVNDNLIDNQSVSQFKSILDIENDSLPSINQIEKLYNEVNIFFNRDVKRRFEELVEFHKSLHNNRRTYLEGEISKASQRILEREKKREISDSRRMDIMNLLNTHGALEQFIKLQSELGRAESELESIRQRYAMAERIEGSETELEIERSHLYIRLLQDYREQADNLRKAILTFESISQSLYEDAGSLKVQASTNGPNFDIIMHGSRSKGVKNMKMFCFDVMISLLAAEKSSGPKFLIHDSHLFDGVDERQVVNALEIGKDLCRNKFQYIVTMNSDVVKDFQTETFNPYHYSLPVRLTDATGDGGLFGFRFQ